MEINKTRLHTPPHAVVTLPTLRLHQQEDVDDWACTSAPSTLSIHVDRTQLEREGASCEGLLATAWPGW